LAAVEDGQLVPLIVLAGAKKIASEMFRAASVDLGWRSGGASLAAKQSTSSSCLPATSRPVVVIVRFRLSNDIPPQPEDVMAYTFPYAHSDASVIIISDRLNRRVSEEPARGAILLAHLIVHEITHLLERVSRHSDAGLMKARWTSRDYLGMDEHPLAFAPVDIELIHLGLTSWRRESCAAGRYVDLVAQGRRR